MLDRKTVRDKLTRIPILSGLPSALVVPLLLDLAGGSIEEQVPSVVWDCV